MTVLHLACAADRGYLPHTAAMLHSMLACRGGLDVHVHLLHGPALPARRRRKLASMVGELGGEITEYEIPDSRVAGLPTFTEITTTMWYRVFLPELLGDVSRVLYVDGDVLAVDSLEPLWKVNLGDHLVGAVTNVFMRDPNSRSWAAVLGWRSLGNYFNSGVLLLNLEALRREAAMDAVRAYAAEHPLLYPDQDALNAVMAARRLELHPRWNCMNSILTFDWADEVLDAQQLAEARRDPGIRHFEGPGLNKPWHRDCTFPHRELYFRHRRGTPWPKVALQPPAGRLRGLRRRLGALRGRANRR